MTVPAYSIPPQATPVIPLPPYVGPVNPSTCAAATLRLWNYLPAYIQQADADAGYIFLSWLDGIGTQQQIIDTLVRDDLPYPGWSIVLDVDRCPTYALPWLAQFMGIRFSGIDQGNDATMRSIIRSQGNFGRGTPAAIVGTILPFLGAGGSVQLIERYPDAYSLSIIISGAINALTYGGLTKEYPLYSELVPGNPPYPALPTYADFPSQSATNVTSAALDSVPAGIVATVTFI